MTSIELLVQGLAPAAIVAVAAYGELLMERAGMLNLGLEGLVYFSSAAAAAAAAATGSLSAGFAVGALAGIALILVYYVAAIVFRANQAVTGLAIVFLGIGLGDLVGSNAAGTPLPSLSLGVKNYASLALLVLPAVVLYALLYRTWVGYAVRSLGEDVEAARFLGVNVAVYRLAVALTAGALAGIAGAFIFLSRPGTWSAGVALGWGWLALGSVILGYWHPVGVAAAAYLIGLANTLIMVLEGLGVPAVVAENTPYIMVVVALALVSWLYERIGARPPALIWRR
ncbi:ABC transporter permease subunit [Hyperthermus butylicus]|uniref:ABC-transporter, permease component n=1 Tax=Hyperthermus butylicus (strain DSM 5456 / JCM 9403 / PLM1-5) TaxID=415426 RepID=A2BJ10_HYPBU|nr:ABC transporter permease [Hyperthermus butylicus]ABM79971.1 ABC-transporter, permease component [Hyperthermus butylicus DSM 5456]